MGIADMLAARIEDGTYPPEARLPAELDLAEEFGSSRSSVRRAVEELRQRGLVETVRGKGTFILPPEERPNGQPSGEG
jgi:GntR family transcriptional regulator